MNLFNKQASNAPEETSSERGSNVHRLEQKKFSNIDNSGDFSPAARKHTLLGVILMHGLNDMHSTSLPTIIPMLAQSISLTMSQAGFLNALFGLTNMFGQPVSGFIADRLRRPWFAVWGPLLSVSGAALLPLAPSFGAAFIFVGMLSMGTALFHPQGFGRCGASAGKNKLAYFLSIFSASGSFGSAIGPIYVVFMISIFGKRGFPAIVIPAAFFICFYIWRHIGHITKKQTEQAQRSSFLIGLHKLFPKVGWIVFMTGARDAVFQSIKIFLPTLLILRGSSIAVGGMLLFVATFCATLAGIAGGKLADKFGDEKILFTSMAIFPLILTAGLHSHGTISLAAFVAGLAFSQASVPVTMAMAQRRCPEARSLASSLAQGVSWGIANIFVTPVGVLADAIGLETALRSIVFLPWVAIVAFVAYHFIKRK